MAEQGTGHRQRLKERFLAGEPSAHGDEVLLELLLTYAIPRIDVQPLARRLVAQFGSLRAVLGAERSELARVHGLGEAAVTLLKLADHLAGAPATARIPRGEPDPLSAHAAGREITINTEARRHGGDGRGAARSGKRLDGPPDGFADTGASTRDSAGAVSMGGPDESA